MQGTGQYTVQPEVLFAHAYMIGADRQSHGQMHPLPPLHPAEVAAFIEARANTSVRLWDSTFRRDEGAFEVAISRERPRIAWIFTHPTTRALGLRFCEVARRSGAVVLVGGPDAQLRPAVYLRAGADAVVLGEGENATLDLVLALRAADYRPDPELLSRIAGIAWMDSHGTLRTHAGAERVVPVDELPLPYRDPESTRVHLERWLKVRRFRPLALRSARGCPLPCGFCTHSVFKRPYRRRRPDSVVKEMRGLAQRYQVDRFVFMDEVFVYDALWLQDFARAMGGSPLSFEASAHPTTVDSESIAALTAAGCKRIELMAASGSGRLLDALGWAHDPAAVFRAANAIRGAGIELGLKLFVGLPGETREDLDQTLQMAELLGPDGIEVTRTDPDSPALFRKDWALVVEGEVLERARRDGTLPRPVLTAASRWLLNLGDSSGAEGFAGRLDRAARQPLLRAAVRAFPGRRRR